MRWLKTLLWMIVFLCVILFFTQNRDGVTLRFSLYPILNNPWFEVQKIPLFFVIICSVLLGVLIGVVGDLYSRLQLKKALRQNNKMIEKLEQEIQSLRHSEFEKPSF
jgi:uncharacterized integral membrane protein